MAPPELRGTSFGLLAAIQSAGDFVASVAVGLIWTLVSPTAGFAVAAVVVAAGGMLPLSFDGSGSTAGMALDSFADYDIRLTIAGMCA